MSYRLPDYWMPKDLITRFNLDGIDFGTETTVDHYRLYSHVIPIAADAEVCTVQKDGEPIEEAMNRAIRAEDLVPLYVRSCGSGAEESKCSFRRAFDACLFNL